MQLRRLSDNQVFRLEPEATLGRGGEATIYRVPGEPKLAAKVYHQPTEARARKLAVMRANLPADPTRGIGHTSLTWPGDLLADAEGQVVGYLMPLVEGMQPVFLYYNPLSRRQHSPLFDYRYLHVAAANLTSAVGALHRSGYVVGDVNESNILLSETALATLVDTDSFQVRDAQTGVVYRCTVGKPDFTPPELQGKRFSEGDRAPAHDLFGLACLLFRLLMEGTHPFDGIYAGEDDPPSQGARIAAGHFPYGVKPVPYRPKPGAPPFTLLPPELQRLFRRCFEEGHADPEARPDAEVWLSALQAAERALIPCRIQPRHLYGSHLSACPWCERTQQLGGVDPFPSVEAVRQGRHLRPVAPARTPTQAAMASASSSASGQRRRRRRRRIAAPLAGAAPTPTPPGYPSERLLRRGLALALAIFLVAVSLPLGRRFLANLQSDMPGEALQPVAQGVPAVSSSNPFGVSPPTRNASLPPPADPAALGQTRRNPRDGATLLWIPAGPFLMGSSAGENEKPPHSVTLTGYWIYKTPVTLAQYRKFCSETGHAMPPAPAWGWQDNHPMVNVTWYDARSYCDWAGVRLPTEAQWEKAARGVEGRAYPWGATWEEVRCRNSVGKRVESTCPVGSFPQGASPYGVLDMAGNVFQWCADWYGERYYLTAPDHNPTGPLSGTGRVLRGGCWGSDDPLTLRATYRYGYNPYAAQDFIGFRGAAW